MTIIAPQCRAARALLGWSQDDLEAASKVAKKTIADFERQARQPHTRTLDAIRSALEAAGVIFIEPNGEGPGVRLRKSETSSGSPT
jgi:transcriptional regulator with XRE-family HTH domain